MDTILEQVNLFLGQALRNEAEMPEAVIEEFGENCKTLLRNSFAKRDGKYTIRMSSIGRPLCQQQMEKAGAERDSEPPHFKFRMLLGDIVEVAALAVMRAAGVNVTAYQPPASVALGDTTIKGTADVVVDDRDLYDVKSASDFQFRHKFAAPDGFSKLVADDAFGYLSQGYLYGEGTGKRFRGWIAVNKETGEWAILRTPIVDNSYRKKALDTAAQNIRAINAATEFKRCFEPTQEQWRGKPTGNSFLPITCSYCSWKETCYKKEGLTYLPQVKSEAKNPKRVYYVGEVRYVREKPESERTAVAELGEGSVNPPWDS